MKNSEIKNYGCHFSANTMTNQVQLYDHTSHLSIIKAILSHHYCKTYHSPV